MFTFDLNPRPEPEPIRGHFFRCMTPKCVDRDNEVQMTMGPSEFRRATGHSVLCAFCNQPMVYRGSEHATAQALLKAIDRANGGCWDGTIRQA